MSLSARAIALQGIGGAVLAFAMQGLVDTEAMPLSSSTGDAGVAAMYSSAGVSMSEWLRRRGMQTEPSVSIDGATELRDARHRRRQSFQRARALFLGKR